jgi:AraC-like DNA-binding protein
MVSELLTQKIFDGMGGGYAYCELIVSPLGKASDYKFIMVNPTFEKQSDRDNETTIGKTIKEINPDVQQSWIDKLGAVVLDNKPTQLIDFNKKLKRYYHVNVFPQKENKFVMLIDDITSKSNTIEKLTFQNDEKVNRAEELIVYNKELKFQNSEKENRISKLILANKKNAFQNDKKEKRAIELGIVKDKTEKTDLIKSVFLTNMSYEIRTPMNGLLGFTELLKSPNLTLEQQQDYIRIIEKFSRSMLVELDFLDSLFKPNFMKFEEVIQQNIYKKITVIEFASLCNMSLSSFKRKFTEVYTVSPIKYLLKMKLRKASELLKDKDYKISHIAYDVGFQSLTTFNRSFKAYYGKSPSEFRMD